MKILLTCTFLFLIILYIDIKTYDKKYSEEENKTIKENELVQYLQDNYESITSSIVNESIEEIVVMDLNKEEDIIVELQQKIFDKFSMIIVREEDETTLKQLNDYIIKSYISLKLVEVDIRKILDVIRSVRFTKNNASEPIPVIEFVPNDTKVDSSIMDITDDLNDIFFKE